MFLGTYTPRLDEKFRLFLPAKFREQLVDGLVITKGTEHCLFVFAAADFAREAQNLRETPGSARRADARVFFASASDEALDRQGRVTIPAALRAYAGLDRDCAVIGANTHIEIWDATAWETYLAERESAFAESEEVVLPGLL